MADPKTTVGSPGAAASIEREIEALKAFLSKYPLPSSVETADEDVAGAPPTAPAAEGRNLSEPEPQAYSSAAGAERIGLLGTRRRKIIAGIVVAAILAAGALTRLPFRSSARDSQRIGTLSVATTPSGLAVLIDGVPHSVTPVTVELAPGNHVLELVTGNERRRVPVTITAGGQVSHFFEIASAAAVPPDAPAAPAAAAAVPTVGSEDSNAAGWISVSAPTELQVRENGRLLGNSSVDKIMLPVGRHQLEFVNEALAYRMVQTVDVIAGDIVPIKPRWPQGSVALNAVPWAEVFIDGQAVGETPISGISLPIGTHEVVFQHPELGERRASITVAMGKTTTLGVDLGVK